ncbi:MAG: phage terminase large subunit [Rhizobiaceae bacterium]|nr:phage terminase large subunit [Rhizobiaceae bacterium]
MTPQIENPEVVVREARRRSLLYFTQYAFNGLNGTNALRLNWHIETIAWHLEEVAAGRIKRLIINLPPRKLKSFVASAAFPAWLLGNDPRKKIIVLSYSQDLAHKHSNDFRRIIEGSRMRELFPALHISPKNTETEQTTSQGGFRLAASVSGSLTGRGADFIIIDDPIKAGSATLSEAERNNVNERFFNSIINRLDSQRDGAIVIVMQRLHVDDLCGHIIETENHGFTVLSIPAIADQDEVWRTGPLDHDVHRRSQGEAIQPEIEGVPELNRLRTQLGSGLFSAQYQQQPIPLEGSIIKRKWLRWYDDIPDRDNFDAVYQSWDTAAGGGQGNDYAVCTTWAVAGHNYYLLNVWRRRTDFPTLRREAVRLVKEWRPNIVLVEKADVGGPLVQELRRDQLPARIITIPPKGDKIARTDAVSALFEEGRVRFPKEAGWMNELLKELLAFPGSKHDDQVDSIVQFLRFIQTRQSDICFDPHTGKRERPRRDNRHSTRAREVTAVNDGVEPYRLHIPPNWG